MFKVNDILTYTAFDEESYSRGYGIQYETRKSRVSELRYKTDSHYQDIGINNILSDNKSPLVGEAIKFQFWDGEEGRSYGWFWNKKEGKVKEIYYKMENGDRVYPKDIKEAKGK